MRDDRVYLQHILDAIAAIESYTAGGRESFLSEPIVRDAALRNLEIIGEAVKNLSIELRSRRHEVPWSRIAALRDVLIHQYFGVDFSMVWEIIERRLPELKREVEGLLATEK